MSNSVLLFHDCLSALHPILTKSNTSQSDQVTYILIGLNLTWFDFFMGLAVG